jgi:hypothetical protein
MASTSAPPKWASLEEKMRWESHDLPVTTHPEGHVSVHGAGRFNHMSASVRDASGKWVIQCYADYDSLDSALAGRTTPPTTEPDPIEYEVSDF